MAEKEADGRHSRSTSARPGVNLGMTAVAAARTPQETITWRRYYIKADELCAFAGIPVRDLSGVVLSLEGHGVTVMVKTSEQSA